MTRRATTSIAALAAVLLGATAPRVASAEEGAAPRVTSVEVERAEGELRAVISIDPPDAPPPYRLMRDDDSLRLIIADSASETADQDLEDQTIWRVRLRAYRGRAVLRLDPHASPVAVLERTEVRPHPRGLVVVVRRSEPEARAYREASQPRRDERREHAAAEPAAADDEAHDRARGDAPAAAAAPEDEAPAPSASREGEGSGRGRRPRRTASEPAPAESSGLVRTAATGAVILLLALAAFYMKRRRGKGIPGAPARSIDIVASRRLGARQSLLLVEVSGQSYLIGVSERGMTRLAELGEEGETAFGGALEAAIETPSRATAAAPEPRVAPRRASTKAAPAPVIDDGPTLDAVEGLLRLKRLAAAAPQKPGRNGAGTDLSLAGLESLLQSRDAN